ncbi:MAG: hypothetical protein D3925_01390 [Candidatus Electrothrix sp. AR5]|nr:hypothetical protein [Candidatus Electrothrix sp. AR5]
MYFKRELEFKPDEYVIVEEKQLTVLQYEYFIQLLDVGRGWLGSIDQHGGGLRNVVRVSAPKRQVLLVDSQNSNYPVAVAIERKAYST